MGYCLLNGIADTIHLEGGQLFGLVRTIDLRYCLLIGIARTADSEGGQLMGVVGTIDLRDGLLIEIFRAVVLEIVHWLELSGPLIKETACNFGMV